MYLLVAITMAEKKKRIISCYRGSNIILEGCMRSEELVEDWNRPEVGSVNCRRSIHRLIMLSPFFGLPLQLLSLFSSTSFHRYTRTHTWKEPPNRILAKPAQNVPLAQILQSSHLFHDGQLRRSPGCPQRHLERSHRDTLRHHKSTPSYA